MVSPAVVLGIGLWNLAACIEAVVIVMLLCFVVYVITVNDSNVRAYERVRDERDETRAILRTIRRMSEIRIEAITRLRGFTQEPR